MAFKFLIFADSRSRVCELLVNKLEDLPYSFTVVEQEQGQDIAKVFQRYTPNLVVYAPDFVFKYGQGVRDLVSGAGDDASFQRELDFAKSIGRHCSEYNAPLIQLSSFNVFGQATIDGPICESLNVDGLSGIDVRLQTLEGSTSAVSDRIVLRSAWLIDQPVTGVLDGVLSLLFNGQQSFVVSDKNASNPVYLRSVVDAVIAMIHQVLCGAENWGIFHLHGSDRCSEAEFVDHLVRMLHGEFDINLIMPEVTGVDDVRQLLPSNGLLHGVRCTENFGVQMISWRNGLKGEVQRWLQANQHQ